VQDRANAIQEALDQYADSRSFDLGPDGPELDEWLCEDTSGRQITRWGFYPEANIMSRQSKSRKRMSSPNPVPEAKKPPDRAKDEYFEDGGQSRKFSNRCIQRYRNRRYQYK
jgi:hypothetical protein